MEREKDGEIYIKLSDNVNYLKFLESKSIIDQPSGFEPNETNKNHFDFQSDIAKWNCRKGKSTDALAPGLGKTIIQLEWIKQCIENNNSPGLILAPLAVTKQTKKEAEKFGFPNVNICRTQNDIVKGINITNYEKIDHFDLTKFDQLVLDESGIIKHSHNKIRRLLSKSLLKTKYRLFCSATPNPNSFAELGNHSELLGIMKLKEMLSMFFTHDGSDTSQWHLREYANDGKFWEWLASWMLMMRMPSDLGYKNRGFELPKHNQHNIIVKSNEFQGFMPNNRKLTLNQRRAARRETVKERIEVAKEIIDKNPDENWLIWVGLNDEGIQAAKELEAIEVAGRHKDEYKTEMAEAFQKGQIPRLVTKAKIWGWGLNLQYYCNNQIFLGLSDSYEELFQARHRIWRFGQEKEVNSYMVTSDREGQVLQNIRRKEEQAEKMWRKIIEFTKDITSKNIDKTKRNETDYNPQIEMVLPNFLMEN